MPDVSVVSVFLSAEALFQAPDFGNGAEPVKQVWPQGVGHGVADSSVSGFLNRPLPRLSSSEITLGRMLRSVVCAFAANKMRVRCNSDVSIP